jgi:drug/metabolite transporter (DMT)-like permease
MVLIGTALIFPLGFRAEAYRDLPSWSVDTWLAAGFLGVFSTAVAYTLFFWAVHRFGPSLAAMVSYLVPVATLVLAFLILADRPSAVQLVGAAVILIGVRFAARRSPAPLRGPAPA